MVQSGVEQGLFVAPGVSHRVQAAAWHGRRPGAALSAAVALHAEPQGAALAPDPASRTTPPLQVQGVVSLWPRQYWVTDLDYLHTYMAQGERGGSGLGGEGGVVVVEGGGSAPACTQASAAHGSAAARRLPAAPPPPPPPRSRSASSHVSYDPPACFHPCATPAAGPHTHTLHRRLVNSPRV